jgi:hypothetical protein
MGVPTEEYAETYVDLLKSQNRLLRAQAAVSIGKMGEKAAPVLPQITELLNDKDLKFRYSASFAFEQLGENAREAVPGIAELLKDPNPVIQMAALNALGRMTTNAEDTIPAIAELLKNKDRDVRGEAVWALGQMSPASDGRIPEMAELLGDKDKLVRMRAAVALGKMGNAASGEAPKIAALLKDENKDTRRAAIVALSRIASPDTAPEIVSYIKGLDNSKQFNSEAIATAAEALGNMRSGAPSASGPVAELLSNPDDMVRSTAVTSLKKMSPVGRETVLIILGTSYSRPTSAADIRYLAHYTAGGDKESAVLIDSLGVDGKEINGEMTREQASGLLGVFMDNWELTEPHESMRKDLASRISEAVAAGQWTKEDLPLLKEAQATLESGQFADQAKVVSGKISQVGG